MDWRLWAAGAFLLLAAIGVRQTSERSGAMSQRAQPLPLRTPVLERQQQPTTESSPPTHEGEAAIANIEPEISADIDAQRFACRAQLAGLRANAASRTVPLPVSKAKSSSGLGCNGHARRWAATPDARA
jgi:hypothetical protein